MLKVLGLTNGKHQTYRLARISPTTYKPKFNIYNQYVPKRSLFAVEPQVYERTGSLALKEKQERLSFEFRAEREVSFVGRWPGGNNSLKLLIHNKHYLHAIDFFNVMRDHTPRRLKHSSYNIIFHLFEEMGSPWDVINNFKHLETWLVPDRDNYLFLLKAYVAVGKIQEAEETLEKIRKLGTVPMRAYIPLIEHALEKKDFEKADNIIKSIPETTPPDICYWNVRILFHYSQKNYEKAEEVFKEILTAKVSPNRTTFQRMLKVHTETKNLKKFTATLFTMVRAGFKADTSTRYLLMDYYAKTGDPEVYRIMDKAFPPKMWCTQPEAYFYRNFLKNYSGAAGPLSQIISTYLEEKLGSGLKLSDIISSTGELTHNKDILEDLYIMVNAKTTEGLNDEDKPVFDTLGDVNKYIGSTDELDEENQQKIDEEIALTGKDPRDPYEDWDPDFTAGGKYVGDKEFDINAFYLNGDKVAQTEEEGSAEEPSASPNEEGSTDEQKSKEESSTDESESGSSSEETSSSSVSAEPTKAKASTTATPAKVRAIETPVAAAPATSPPSEPKVRPAKRPATKREAPPAVPVAASAEAPAKEASTKNAPTDVEASEVPPDAPTTASATKATKASTSETPASSTPETDEEPSVQEEGNAPKTSSLPEIKDLPTSTIFSMLEENNEYSDDDLLKLFLGSVFQESEEETKMRLEAEEEEKIRSLQQRKEETKARRILKRLELLQKEKPELYERIFKLYRYEVHGEPIDDDEYLEFMAQNPLVAVLERIKTTDSWSRVDSLEVEGPPKHAVEAYHKKLKKDREAILKEDTEVDQNQEEDETEGAEGAEGAENEVETEGAENGEFEEVPAEDVEEEEEFIDEAGNKLQAISEDAAGVEDEEADGEGKKAQEEKTEDVEIDEETAKQLGDQDWVEEENPEPNRFYSPEELGMSPDRPYIPKPNEYPFTLDIVNSFPVQSMVAWDNTLGPSVENKMLHTRYMEILRSKEPKIGRRHE